MVGGHARMDVVPRVPDDRGGVHGRGLRPPPPPARHRSRVELRQDVRRPEPRGRTGSSPCAPARSRRSARTVDTKRVLEREEFAPGPARRVRRSRSPASGSSACGRRPRPSTRRSWRAPDAGRHASRQLPRRRRLRRRRAASSSTASSRSCAPATTRSPPPTPASTSAGARTPRPATSTTTSAAARASAPTASATPASASSGASSARSWRAPRTRATAIDERLVQGVDANDTGQNISTALVEGIRPMTVSGVIAAHERRPGTRSCPRPRRTRASPRPSRSPAASSSARSRARRPTGAGWTSSAARSSAPPTRA